MAPGAPVPVAWERCVWTRGLHSSTFRLNLSAFYGIGVHF
jgi:hypothetical protein